MVVLSSSKSSVINPLAGRSFTEEKKYLFILSPDCIHQVRDLIWRLSSFFSARLWILFLSFLVHSFDVPFAKSKWRVVCQNSRYCLNLVSSNLFSAAFARHICLWYLTILRSLVKDGNYEREASHIALIGSLASWRIIPLAFHEEPPGTLLLRLIWKETGWWSEKVESPIILYCIMWEDGFWIELEKD